MQTKADIVPISDIVPLSTAHLAAIETLEAQLFEQPASAEMLASFHGNPASVGYVLIRRDQTPDAGSDAVSCDIAAYALALNSGLSADLVTIGTAQSCQRCGFGRAVLDHLVAALRDSGTRWMPI